MVMLPITLGDPCMQLYLEKWPQQVRCISSLHWNWIAYNALMCSKETAYSLTQKWCIQKN